MTDFRFNTCVPREYKDRDTQEIKYSLCKGGDAMQILTLLEAQQLCNPNRPKGGQPWCQLFDNGYRVTNDNIDWKDWNGFTFSDVDSKHFYNNVHKFDVNLLFVSLWYQAIIKNPDNFCCIYLSASKTSYRILWYWDCERTEDNFKKCCKLSDDYTKELFYSLGTDAKQIIDYKEVDENGKITAQVLDPCAHSSKQGFYLTTNEIKFNKTIDQDDFGKCDLSGIKIEAPKNNYTDIDLEGIEQHNNVFIKGVNKVTDKVAYYPHSQRWCIYDALIVAFKDKKAVDAHWDRICKLIPEKNGHK